MRFFPGTLGAIGVFVCAGCLAGQESEDPAVTAARQRIAQLQGLVEAGAIPRAQVQKAEEALADAQDGAFLRKTLYGAELTEETAGQMVEAANRRYLRKQAAFEQAKKLVDVGATGKATLDEPAAELDLAKQEVNLAESRARLTQEIAEMAKAETSVPERHALQLKPETGVTEHYEGNGTFSPRTFAKVESAFEGKFGKPLPVSAMGETAVHRALGFDHTGRVDVAVNPDQPEGVWLRTYLTENHIPYFAFRHAVPGKATGAHIHMGPESTRLAARSVVPESARLAHGD
jgi:hypothetical protein